MNIPMLGYTPKDVAIFAKNYYNFYEMYKFIKAPLVKIEEKKEFAEKIENIFKRLFLKCPDVLMEERILLDMDNKIRELNKTYPLDISQPNLEYILKKLEKNNKRNK